MEVERSLLDLEDQGMRQAEEAFRPTLGDDLSKDFHICVCASRVVLITV